MIMMMLVVMMMVMMMVMMVLTKLGRSEMMILMAMK